jgi:hypothetical protein
MHLRLPPAARLRQPLLPKVPFLIAPEKNIANE